MSAEIPGCLWIPAHYSRYKQRPQGRAAYDQLIIHITDGHGIAQDTAAEWQKPGTTSAHLVVGTDATAIQCVSFAFAAQHAHDLNSHTIGIEHGCRSPKELGPNDPGLPPNDPLYQKSAFISAYLLKAAGYPPTRDYVKGHAEADPKTTHDDCPTGCGWDWDKYMKYIVGAYMQIGEVEKVA